MPVFNSLKSGRNFGPPGMVRYRWLVFAILSATYLLVYFHRQAPAVLAFDLMGSLGLNGAWLGFISSAYFYPYAVMQVPSGMLVQRWGSRIILCVSLCLAGAGSAVFAFSMGPATALLGRTMVGFGVAAVLVAILETISHWFKRRQFVGLVGLLLAVGGLGVFAGAGPLAHLDHALGWRGSFWVIAAVSFMLAVCQWVLVRDDPGQLGFPQAEDPPEDAPGPARIGIGRGMMMVLGNAGFWAPAIWGFLALGIFISLGGLWGGPFLMHVYGLSKVETGHVLSMLAVGMVLGSPLLAFMAELGAGSRKRLLVAASAVLTGLCALMVLIPASLPLWALYVWFGLMSLVSMAAAPLALTIARESVSGDVSAVATGLCNFFFLAGGAAMQPLAGWMLDASSGGAAYTADHFAWCFRLYLAVAAAALVAALLIKEPDSGGVAD